jgi:hypothetical protein
MVWGAIAQGQAGTSRRQLQTRSAIVFNATTIGDSQGSRLRGITVVRVSDYRGTERHGSLLEAGARRCELGDDRTG